MPVRHRCRSTSSCGSSGTTSARSFHPPRGEVRAPVTQAVANHHARHGAILDATVLFPADRAGAVSLLRTLPRGTLLLPPRPLCLQPLLHRVLAGETAPDGGVGRVGVELATAADAALELRAADLLSSGDDLGGGVCLHPLRRARHACLLVVVSASIWRAVRMRDVASYAAW